MIGFVVGWWRARAARPVLWWVLGLLAYATLPLPQEWVLLLIVGLGLADIIAAALQPPPYKPHPTPTGQWGQ